MAVEVLVRRGLDVNVDRWLDRSHRPPRGPAGDHTGRAAEPAWHPAHGHRRGAHAPDRPHRRATRAYLVHAHASPVLLVHAATAPNAVLHTLPVLPARLWVASFDAASAAAAAITATYAPATAAPRSEVTPAPLAATAPTLTRVTIPVYGR